jgi:hypothetical protein
METALLQLKEVEKENPLEAEGESGDTGNPRFLTTKLANGAKEGSGIQTEGACVMNGDKRAAADPAAANW